MRKGLATGLLAAAALAIAISGARAETIVVGGKNFTEQLLMAAMTTDLLKAKGYEVDQKTGLGSVALRQAEENGQVDVYWEYTGTSLITYNKIKDRMSAAD